MDVLERIDCDLNDSIDNRGHVKIYDDSNVSEVTEGSLSNASNEDD